MGCGRQYPGWRLGCGAPDRGVHAVCPGDGHRGRLGDPGRQRRRGSCGDGDASGPGHRPGGSRRERDDRGADQGSEYVASTLESALVSLFGILAVIIAAVGIAGVLAFSVSARTTEIGIRMSLGADSGRVQRMILSEGGVLLAIGLVLGVAGAFFAARLIQGLLFGVAPYDPATFIGVAAMMAVIGIGACWLPALRAARIDPAITMRAL
jgi:predicted lysophospholipase L1 biosynthesis ABC-type transport system permease subunit